MNIEWISIYKIPDDWKDKLFLFYDLDESIYYISTYNSCQPTGNVVWTFLPPPPHSFASPPYCEEELSKIIRKLNGLM